LATMVPPFGVGRAVLSIRHPDGSTQQLDISEKNYRDLKLAGVGKTLKKRERKPGSTTTAGGPTHAPSALQQQAARQRLTGNPPGDQPSGSSPAEVCASHSCSSRRAGSLSSRAAEHGRGQRRPDQDGRTARAPRSPPRGA
jgi:hypothetical protein